MANEGSHTNLRQFFITFAAPLTHVDRKHSIFGQVVGEQSLQVLEKLKQQATHPKTNRPVTPIVIQRTEILVNPAQEAVEWMKTKLEEVLIQRKESSSSKSRTDRVESKSTSTNQSSGVPQVGKYLPKAQSANTAGVKRKERGEDYFLGQEGAVIKTSKKTKPKASKFGDFSGW